MIKTKRIKSNYSYLLLTAATLSVADIVLHPGCFCFDNKFLAAKDSARSTAMLAALVIEMWSRTSTVSPVMSNVGS